MDTDGVGVGGVAVEHLDGDRTPVAVAQQSEHDLELVAPAVARVPTLGQWTASPFKVSGSQVVEHQRAVAQVASGQTLLDGALALEQPVHGGVELVFVDALDAEHLGEVDGLSPDDTLILDVRFNRGGDERLAAEIAGRFVERPVTYALHRYRDASTSSGFFGNRESDPEPDTTPDSEDARWF